MSKVQVAFENIRVVVLNARMTGPEHGQLGQDLALIAQRCQLADELEKAENEGKELRKDPEKIKVPNKIAKKLGKKDKKR